MCVKIAFLKLLLHLPGANELKSCKWCSIECLLLMYACIDGLTQDYSSSIANALGLLQSCTNPLVFDNTKVITLCALLLKLQLYLNSVLMLQQCHAKSLICQIKLMVQWKTMVNRQDPGKNYSLVPNNKNSHKGTFPHSTTKAKGRVPEMLYIFV